MNDELLDIINDNNEVIGQANRVEIYKNNLSHRIVHVMLFNYEKIYIQKRSEKVSYLPGHYCTSAGGHVRSAESPEAAALRELNEEIGLTGPIESVDNFIFNNKNRIRIFLFRKDFSSEEIIKLCPSEVSDGAFYSPDEIRKLNKELFHPQLIPCLNKFNIYL